MYMEKVLVTFGMLKVLLAVWLRKTKVGWLFFKGQFGFCDGLVSLWSGGRVWGGLVCWWCDVVFLATGAGCEVLVGVIRRGCVPLGFLFCECVFAETF